MLTTLYAGPFGLEFGWKIADLQENNIDFVFENRNYNVALYEVFPEEKHDLMDHYYVYIDQTYGIVEIRCHFFNQEYYDIMYGTVKTDARKEISAELSSIYNFYNCASAEYNDYWLYDFSFNRWVYEKKFSSLSCKDRMLYKIMKGEEEYENILYSQLLYIIEMPSLVTGFSKRNEWDDLTCLEWKNEGYTVNDIVIFRNKDFANAYARYTNSSKAEIMLNSSLI